LLRINNIRLKLKNSLFLKKTIYVLGELTAAAAQADRQRRAPEMIGNLPQLPARWAVLLSRCFCPA